TVGACVTTADIEDGRLGMPELPILSAIAAGIAYRAVRNRGTIGGSLCHADPAGDWLPVLSALGAECIAGDGRRAGRIPVAQFVTGAFEVVLEPAELLQAVRVPRPSRGARCGYYKVCRKAGEFALASAAVLLDRDRRRFRAVIGATAGLPHILLDARAVFAARPETGGAGCLVEKGATARLRRRGLSPPATRRPHLTSPNR